MSRDCVPSTSLFLRAAASDHRLIAVATVALLLSAFTPAAAWAEGPQFAFELTVEAPAKMQDPFQVRLTETLVGAKPGVSVSITYKLVVVDPDQEQHVLHGPVSESNSFGGGHAESTIGYWPRQNGEFIFRILQIDGNAETVLAERRVTTDLASAISPALPSGTRPDGVFAVTGLRTIPEQPTVGQSVTIQVVATNSSTQSVSQTVPVVLSDDSGEQTLAIGSFTLDAGLSGTAEVTWIPERATMGLLQVGDQVLRILVLDGASSNTPGQFDHPDTTDSPPDVSGGD